MKTKHLITILILSTGLSACNHSSTTNDGSYQQKVQTVEEMERAEPATFLAAEGTYNKTLFGDKIKIHGKIKNTATVASYKDVVVKVTYYSKTQTALGSNSYTVYDFFPPHGEKEFEMKIDDLQATETVGLDVVSATPN